ncbi:plasmid mobilization protein [Burkholderia ubonensis]|uniref:plasmid mobilization protein n=1 Tax=Burkholderia ubonensis TaxID=101571 RepID=UPI0009B5078D|nr:plasmid mobilization relaxosome protein MobC [Burkholderia ubonensis]
MARPAKTSSTGQRLTERLAFRVSEGEKVALTAKANQAGLDVSEYLRECIVGNRTQVIERSVVRALLRELNAIGNNLNQIARQNHMDHQAGRFDKDAFLVQGNALRSIQSALDDVLKKC